MSSFIDVQEAEQDEWLDVTTKEEILQREIDALKRALDEKSFELTETKITVDVLKGHKILLENERSSLQDELCTQTATLSTVRDNLEASIARENSVQAELQNVKAASAQQAQNLQDSIDYKTNELDLANDKIVYLTSAMSNLEVCHKKESSDSNMKIQDLVGLVNQLQGQIVSMQTTMKEQQTELTDCKQKLMESSVREERLRQQVAQEKNVSEQHIQELKALRGETGSIAIMAENLRVEKLTLERNLTRNQDVLKHTQMDLQETRAREESVKNELSELKLSSDQRILELTQALTSNTCDLEESHELVQALTASLDDLREQMVDVQYSLDVECDTTRRMKEEHERLSHQLAVQEKEQSAREERLREDLIDAREATQRRLDELRVILGVRQNYVPPKFSFGGYQPPILGTVMSLV